MLDLSTAVLCDFAQVRDRLLFVSSGAVSRLYRQELPSPLGLMVGLVIEVPLEDAGMEHRLRAEVINRHGTVLATLENLFRVSDVGLFPHEVQQVPLVLSITGVRARTWGTHQVRLYLDDDLVRALTLYVVPAAGPQAVVRATPTQSRVADDEGSLGGTGTDGVDAPPADGEVIPVDDPAQPLPWGAPVGADDAPDGDGAHEIVIDLDTTDDGPEPRHDRARRRPPPTRPLAVDDGAPSEDPPPSPATPGPEAEPVAWETPAPEPAPAWDAPAPDAGGEAAGPSPWAPAPAPSDEAPRRARRPSPAPGSRPAPAPAPCAAGTTGARRPSRPGLGTPRPRRPARPALDRRPAGRGAAAPLYDFDEDDLDADPPSGPSPCPPPPSPRPGGRRAASPSATATTRTTTPRAEPSRAEPT